MGKLTVTVGGLIEVHEIHVDLRPREIAVELSVEMQERLGQCLKTRKPPPGRRKGVHPGDDANPLVRRASFDAGREDRLGVLDDRLPNDSYRQRVTRV